MAEHITGGNLVLLFIDPAGGSFYDTIVCLNAQTFNSEANVIDATTKCGSDSIPGIPPAETIDYEGVQLFNPGSGSVSGADLYDLKKAGTIFSWKIAKATPVTGDVTKTGKGFISSLSEEYSKDAPVSFSGTITVKGETTQTVTA